MSVRGAEANRGLASPADVPAKCPACGARDIVTASKVIDASTYWRCGACGEVWNVARQRAGARMSPYRQFGR